MAASERAIVILGSRTDPHVERVATILEKSSDVDVHILDYHDNTRFELSVDEHGDSAIVINGKLVPENRLVWDRRKILPGTVLYINGDDAASTGYVAREWRAFYTLMCGMSAGRVVNSLESRTCMVKPHQQVIAASVGFSVPSTLITNDKTSAQAFQERTDGSLIMKSVAAGKVTPATDGGDYVPFNVMTMRLDDDDLKSASEEEVAFCPHFLQHEIMKSHELRIVVVGDRILPFRIGSQGSRTSEVDWRKGIMEAKFSACAISDELEDKIRKLMSKMGLFFGSLDIVVDRAGEDWFLEVNQDGAWGWLDDIVSGEVAEAFAEQFRKKLQSIEDRASVTVGAADVETAAYA